MMKVYKDPHHSAWEPCLLQLPLDDLKAWILDQGVPGGLRSHMAQSVMLARRQYHRAHPPESMWDEALLQFKLADLKAWIVQHLAGGLGGPEARSLMYARKRYNAAALTRRAREQQQLETIPEK